MTVENCELLNKAKALAAERGLDPAEVVCGGCTEGTDCHFGDDKTLAQIISEEDKEQYTLEQIKNKFFPNWTLEELSGKPKEDASR